VSKQLSHSLVRFRAGKPERWRAGAKAKRRSPGARRRDFAGSPPAIPMPDALQGGSLAGGTQKKNRLPELFAARCSA